MALLFSETSFVLGRGSFWDGVDQEVVEWLTNLRSDTITPIAEALNGLTNGTLVRLLGIGALFALVVLKRWRRLLAFAALLFIGRPVLLAISNVSARPRPDDVEILASWAGFAFPSIPIAGLTFTVVGLAHAFVVAGKARTVALFSAALVAGLVSLARIYLAVDRLTDVAAAAILATAATILLFRLWAPDDAFPITYTRHKTAHLALTELRRTAIVNGLRDQLGLEAVDVKLFALEASGGSSPLLITLAHEPGRVFAKLYAQNHVRSDRWYKLGRSLLYGALEDERPFRSVKALAEYEDYIMRLMHAAGVPGPAAYGIVEITPGREYLLVTEFIEAEEISEAEVDSAVIDRGLHAVRMMWNAGLAHRDVKPGNILVHDDQVYLIDAAFGETRPSAWREAVDLANMMLTLALRSSSPTVYAAARQYFSEEEISEALAATRGVTIPSELRRALANDHRDVLGELRGLAPSHPPVRIQRWTRRRVGLLIGIGVLSVIVAWVLTLNISYVGGLL
jgi:tRNA A-37 threonylcarbamoyl transferase component Bud32/membrane-associated phospholipid phosphatase